MGNPINIPNKNTKENINENINYNLRGRIPPGHVDLGKGLCPFDKRHTLHLIHNNNDGYKPIKYLCINCGYTRDAATGNSL